MKFNSRSPLSWLSIAALVLVLVAVTGCASMRDAMFRPITTTNFYPALAITNVVPHETAVVSATEKTVLSSAGEAVKAVTFTTNVVTTLVTNVITMPAQTVVLTNAYERRPEFMQTVGEVGAIVPGYGSIAAAGVGLASSIWLGWLNRRNKGAAVAVIKGIEDFRSALQTTDEGRKIDAALLKTLSGSKEREATDIAAQLAKLVAQHTGHTKNGTAVAAVLAELQKLNAQKPS